jgi:hypothetical protein
MYHKSNFSFGAASPLCTSNDCKQEVVNAFYSVSPDSPGLQGTLKIENKTTSTPDIIKYSMIPFAGNFHVTGVEEKIKSPGGDEDEKEPSQLEYNEDQLEEEREDETEEIATINQVF